MAEETLYERLTPAEFESRIKTAAIAYLPLGTLEWHGPHLPLGSDFLQSQSFFIQLARRVGGIVLPPLFLGPDRMQEVNGVEYYGMDLTKKVPNPPQQLKGSAYWVHGPSTDYFVKNGKSLGEKFDLVIMTIWRRKEDREPSLEFQYDHAATNETSIMMALHPSLVYMEYLPKDIKEWPMGIWGKDPREYASATHGEKIIDIHLGRMESILREQLVKLRCE